MPSPPSIEPIQDADLPEFAAFLQRHQDPRIPVAAWVAAFQQPWAAEKPNNGFLLRSAGEIVGGIGAIYSDQRLRGRGERFCNLTSWCVLAPHRTQSTRLALALVSQPGFHFTDLTPTDVVKGVLGFLKFREMDPGITLLPNLPRPRFSPPATRVVREPSEIEGVLPEVAARAWREHRHLPWLEHLAIGGAEGFCHVVFKRGRAAGLPAAIVLAASDPPLFARHRGALGACLVREHRMPITAIETRLLHRRPALSLQRRGPVRMFRSDTLSEADISNLYTERVALDI